MVAPEHRIANFDFVTLSMSTKSPNKRPANIVDNIPQDRSPSHPSVRGPQSVSPSPMGSFSSLEVDYAEYLLVQNSMDIELDSTLDLNNQRSWVDQADNRSPFPQNNMPSGQNKANTPDPVAYLTGINLVTTFANLVPSAILY